MAAYGLLARQDGFAATSLPTLAGGGQRPQDHAAAEACCRIWWKPAGRRLNKRVHAARFDPATATEWPAAREIAVVDARETTHYVSVLSLADPAFAWAWSRYRPIAAFNGLVAYKRGRGGCRDVWVAAGAETGIQTR